KSAMNRRDVRRAIALAWMATSALAAAAHGEVHVEGTPAAVRITTSDDSIGDVLLALDAAFRVKHRGATTLETAANPSYAGPIDRVIANLLDGFNYVVRKGQDTTEI